MRARALSFGTILLCLPLALSGCFDGHGRHDDAGASDGGGAYLACAAARDDVAVGAPCGFADVCESAGACCRQRWSCAGGVVAAETECVDRCFRDCTSALGSASRGDACEGAFECTAFEGATCRARTVACVGGAISIEDFVAMGCVPACEGYVSDPTARPCADAEDCESGARCVAPGEEACGGACRVPVRSCAGDPDCPDGTRCVERPDPCSCDGSGSTACEPDCALAGCPHDQECGADGGCRRIECELGTDCSCGACVNGACHDGPGACRAFAP